MPPPTRLSDTPAVGAQVPIRFLAGGLIVLLLTLGWLWSLLYLSYQEMEALRTNHRRSKEVHGMILMLGELLTMSARMAATTGDPRWEQRYLAHVPQLREALDEEVRSATGPALIQAARRLRDTSRDLEAMERAAMQARPGGRDARGQGRLDSPLYADRKAQYAAAATAYHTGLDVLALANRDREQRASVAFLVGTGLALVLTTLCGGVVYLRLDRWQRQTLVGLAQLRAAQTRFDALHQQHELILDSAAEGIFGLDMAGQVTFANPAAESMLGWSRGELLGLPMQASLQHSQADGSLYGGEDCPIQTALLAGRALRSADEVFWRQDGTSFPVEFASNPLVDGDLTVGAVVAFRDISDRFEKERLKNETIAALSQAKALKDHFLSMVSHELQTPVGIILSSADLLRFAADSGSDGSQRRHLDKIQRHTRRLHGLIGDLLDATQIEAGSFHLDRRPMSMVAVVNEAMEGLESLATKRNQRVERRCPPEVPTISGDPDRLVQVMSNLLQNASKFTPRGGAIQVTVTVSGGSLRCLVTDTGPGIAPADQARLFVRFSQIDEPIHREGRSLGIGLFICKALVEAHGGTIGVDSAAGAGSTFWFTLPLVVATPDGA